MSSGLAGRLSKERHRRFVGRVAERDLFRSAISTDELPFNVLYVFGPGGVGKTTLLREFAYICEQADTLVCYMDARNLDPTPDAFMSVLWSVMGLDTQDSPFQALASRPECQVVLIDTYEMLAPLNTWMDEVFLPQLPERVLVVLASAIHPKRAGSRIQAGRPSYARCPCIT